MVTRAVAPTSGDAALGGASVLTRFPAAARRLGVVNQQNTLWDALSCRAHLELFGRLRLVPGKVAEAVAETLERVELAQLRAAQVELTHVVPEGVA